MKSLCSIAAAICLLSLGCDTDDSSSVDVSSGQQNAQVVSAAFVVNLLESDDELGLCSGAFGKLSNGATVLTGAKHCLRPERSGYRPGVYVFNQNISTDDILALARPAAETARAKHVKSTALLRTATLSPEQVLVSPRDQFAIPLAQLQSAMVGDLNATKIWPISSQLPRIGEAVQIAGYPDYRKPSQSTICTFRGAELRAAALDSQTRAPNEAGILYAADCLAAVGSDGFSGGPVFYNGSLIGNVVEFGTTQVARVYFEVFPLAFVQGDLQAFAGPQVEQFSVEARSHDDISAAYMVQGQRVAGKLDGIVSYFRMSGSSRQIAWFAFSEGRLRDDVPLAGNVYDCQGKALRSWRHISQSEPEKRPDICVFDWVYQTETEKRCTAPQVLLSIAPQDVLCPMTR